MIRSRTAPRTLAVAILGLVPVCCSAGAASADPPIVPMPGDPGSPVISRRNDVRNQDEFGKPSNRTFPTNSGTPHMSVQTADRLPPHEHPIIAR
ncbi:MAG: hypothetical protein ACRC20_05200 [Segniliparus sp.]|uniref:hypothetical protein n=1 Tax=Segniliparus sp. TaxID=2804064 RepID=UPI003F327DC0